MTETTPHTTTSADLASYRWRRERELSSLYATARSLTALGEIDAVLESIVRQAHELIGTDFTYLSLVSDGELVLTASEGLISSTFNAARVPTGTGVGGRVMNTGAPAWVSNYLEAHDVPHDAYVRRAGAPRGHGGPARRTAPGRRGGGGGAVRRRPHRAPFRARRGRALSAFADHAAIALNNARLYDESRSALKELQAAYATIEGQVALMERAQSVHESLTRVVLKGGGAPEVAELLVTHLQGTVTVFDRTGAVVATCSHADDDLAHPLQRPSPDAVEQARQSGRWATTTDRSGVWHSAATIQAGDTHLGALLLTRSYEPAQVEIRTLERAAQIMGLLILKETAVAEAEERVSGELLAELLAGAHPVDPSQRARAQARGIDVSALNVLVVAESDTDCREGRSQAARDVERAAGIGAPSIGARR